MLISYEYQSSTKVNARVGVIAVRSSEVLSNLGTAYRDPKVRTITKQPAPDTAVVQLVNVLGVEFATRLFTEVKDSGAVLSYLRNIFQLYDSSQVVSPMDVQLTLGAYLVRLLNPITSNRITVRQVACRAFVDSIVEWSPALKLQLHEVIQTEGFLTSNSIQIFRM